MATTAYTTTAIAAIPAVTAAVVNALAYPVGAIYTSIVSTNPATTLGIGTWTAFGAGRVLVGLNASDSDFDTVEETGGAKTHELTTAELPAHSHTTFSDSTVSASSTTSNITSSSSVAKSTGQSSAYEGYITRAGTSAATLGKSSDTGSGTAHTNVQPYIVVYFWKRTA